MQHRIFLTLHNVDGALVRTLAMVERRGFSIRDVRANVEQDSISVVLDVHSPDRQVDNLCRQIRKLHDVTAVGTSKTGCGGGVSCSSQGHSDDPGRPQS